MFTTINKPANVQMQSVARLFGLGTTTEKDEAVRRISMEQVPESVKMLFKQTQFDHIYVGADGKLTLDR